MLCLCVWQVQVLNRTAHVCNSCCSWHSNIHRFSKQIINLAINKSAKWEIILNSVNLLYSVSFVDKTMLCLCWLIPTHPLDNQSVIISAGFTQQQLYAGLWDCLEIFLIVVNSEVLSLKQVNSSKLVRQVMSQGQDDSVVKYFWNVIFWLGPYQKYYKFRIFRD